MTGEGIKQGDLVISKLLRLEPSGYKSIFPHLSAAIQLSSQGKTLMKGEYSVYLHQFKTRYVD